MSNYIEQKQEMARPLKQPPLNNWLEEVWKVVPRRVVIAGLLAVALLAFELFNFDTTRYALTSFLGDIRFLGLAWASILAIAFCAIDFAGLVRVFTPETGRNEPKEVWFLMGAWLVGATLNAVMTWWAVNLALLNHNFGNEVLSREQLLKFVPIFVAVLVWLTRILFIGSLSVAGEKLLGQRDERQPSQVQPTVGTRPQPAPQPVRPVTARPTAMPGTRPQPPHRPTTPDLPDFLRPDRATSTVDELPPANEPLVRPVRPTGTHNRVRQRPPLVDRPGATPAGMQARPRR
ncbi:MAG: hypothetical protein KJ063_18710 [Anaerolineae bacterium]|nr:hypothetical protein [Anaerolineae bacterium]